MKQTPRATELTLLTEACVTLGLDELRVLRLLAERLKRGTEVYGYMHVAKDTRNLPREACEEFADAAVYSAMIMLRESEKQ